MKRILVFVLGLILGSALMFYYFINNVKTTTFDGHIATEGYRIITLTIFNNDYHFIEDVKGYQSVND